jgi:cell division protein FtsB
MRYLALALAFLIVVLQYPLWLGKGGWLRVWDLDRQVALQKEQNDKLKRRNNALDAEVRDLKQGFEAVEERARYELGMVRSDEIFFQIIPPATGGSAAPAVSPSTASPSPASPSPASPSAAPQPATPATAAATSAKPSVAASPKAAETSSKASAARPSDTGSDIKKSR